MKKITLKVMYPKCSLHVMEIRDAAPSDNGQLLELQKLSPMGRALILQLDSSPDYFNRARGYKDWHVIVAEEGGKILGTASYAVQDKLLMGETVSMVYEFSFMVHPDARRRGIASILQNEIEARNPEADYLHLNITEDNVVSDAFFTKMGFSSIRGCATFMMMAYKEFETDPYRIRPMKEGDIPVVVDIINETYKGYEFFTPFTEASFRDHYSRLPFFDLEDIYIFEHETIRAVAGLWDYNKVMSMTMLGFDTKRNLMRLVVNFLGRFTTLPKMPEVGEKMSLGYLTPLGYGDPESAKQLLLHLLNIAKSEGIGLVSAILDRESHVTELLTDITNIDGRFKWYIKPISRKSIPELDGKQLYIDVKDI